MAQTVSTEQLAAFLRKDVRTIQRYVSNGILRRARDSDGKPLRGAFELVPSIHAYLDYLEEQLSVGLQNDTEFRRERTGLVKAQRERQELENQLFKGQLHRADDVEAIMNDVLSGIKIRFLSIPSRIARLLIAQTAIAKIIDILTRAVYEALGDVMTYSAEAFASRNAEYLAAAGIDRVELLSSSEPNSQANGEENGDAAASDDS
jgi:phage terminase Nu1 subunit (DNA packaging protein)